MKDKKSFLEHYKKNMRGIFILFYLLLINGYIFGQDTLNVQNVRIDISEKQQIDSLLPENYLFTQRILWGKNGLMRNFKIFELSEKSRNTEMYIRSYSIKAHEYLGYASLIGMIGTGITGQQLYTGSQRNKDLHEGFAGFTNICYISTATLAFLQPPPMQNRKGSLTKLGIHRTLSIIHLSSMIATNVLSGLQEDKSYLKPYHKAAAITAFSSLFLATIVIKL